MGLERFPDHVEQGLELLLEQFKGKPRIAAWLKSYLRQCQLLEDATYDVIIKRLIDNAEGDQLDVIGRIVGEERLGRTDAIFKLFISARIRINRSKGAIQDLIDVLSIVSETAYRLDELFPASIHIEFGAVPETDPVLLFGMMHDTKAGGIGLRMTAPTTTADKVFIFSNAGDADVADNGFGDANNPDTFGLLSDAVTIR